MISALFWKKARDRYWVLILDAAGGKEKVEMANISILFPICSTIQFIPLKTVQNL